MNGMPKVCEEIKIYLLETKLSSYENFYPLHNTIAECISVCECTGLKSFQCS